MWSNPKSSPSRRIPTLCIYCAVLVLVCASLEAGPGPMPYEIEYDDDTTWTQLIVGAVGWILFSALLLLPIIIYSKIQDATARAKARAKAREAPSNDAHVLSTYVRNPNIHPDPIPCGSKVRLRVPGDIHTGVAAVQIPAGREGTVTHVLGPRSIRVRFNSPVDLPGHTYPISVAVVRTVDCTRI
jgi:hypothetical protein